MSTVLVISSAVFSPNPVSAGATTRLMVMAFPFLFAKCKIFVSVI